MDNFRCRQIALAAASALLLAAAAPSAGAQAAGQGAATGLSEAKQDASRHIAGAAQTVKAMRRDARIEDLMKKAVGIFIIPDYGRAALGARGQGGAGVLVVRRGKDWAWPGFYSFGAIGTGAQAGVTAKRIALLLMSDKALNAFGNDDRFALNADAGLSIVDDGAQSGDIIVWSSEKRAFASRDVGVDDVKFDRNQTSAFYGKPVSARDIVTGNAAPKDADSLMRALPH